jgi:uncharacterized membrane protein
LCSKPRIITNIGGFYMLLPTKKSTVYLSLILGIFFFSNCHAAEVSDSLELYTPWTKISVPPGESIEYNVEVINNSKEIKNVEISLSGLPRGWNYDLKAGSYNISQVATLPGEKKGFILKVEVPMKVNKGSYHFRIVAGRSAEIPITVIVSEQGTFKTEFTAQQTNMQGNSTSKFSFQTAIKNLTADKQPYALMADAPRGWDVTFNSDYQKVTSVSIDPGVLKNITIDIDPPDMVEAGTYKIPVRAVTSSTTASLDLEVVITGSYSMVLTTPTGLLSTSITAGDEKRLELKINNTGSSLIKDIQLSAETPTNWEVIFDPKKVDNLLAGGTAQVFATIKANKKAIAGDYVTNIEAKTPEVSSRASFRVSVRTPMLQGWIGIFIIVVALGSVYYLFRKFGRR